MSAGTVYVVQSGQYYKIGFTANLPMRLRALQHQYGDTCVLLGVITCAQADELEQALHKHFAADHRRGDWYQLSPEQVRWLCDLGEGDTWLQQYGMALLRAPRQTMLRCFQCGYLWMQQRQGPIKHGPPQQCPSCHSIRWHKRTPYDPSRPRRRRKKEAP